METCDRTFSYVADLADLSESGCHVVYVDGKAIALFRQTDQIFALDMSNGQTALPVPIG